MQQVEAQARDVADIALTGTPIVLYGATVKNDLGTAWVAKVRPGNGTDGCPQWLKDVVIAEDKSTAIEGAKNEKLEDVEPNSCCLDSRDVTIWEATRLQDNSVKMVKRFVGMHALVVNFNLKKPSGTPPTKRVQMNEVWVSPDPLPDLLNLTGRSKIRMQEATGEEDDEGNFKREINRFARAFAQTQCHNETP